MKPQKDKDGYYRVNLYKKKKVKTHLVHRLVGLAFIPNPNNRETIDHIDKNPSNNHIDNLRWATSVQQGQNTGKRKDNQSGFKGV